MKSSHVTLAVVSAAAIGLALGAAAQEANAPLRQPSVKVGPFQIAVERITQNRDSSVTFVTRPGQRPDAGVQGSRRMQVQFTVTAENAAVAAGLATVQLNAIKAESGRRVVDLGHYGGLLDSPDPATALRAYVFIPKVPLGARELQSVDGELVHYEKSGQLEIAVPLDGAKLPHTVEKEGVKATVRELKVEGTAARLVLEVEGAPTSALVNVANDGTYGVALLNRESRPAAPTGGTMVQARPNMAEYRLGFQNVRGTPGTVQLRLLHRGGQRRVYPFRLEHIPIPARATAPP